VDLRARLRPGVTPQDVQALLEEAIDKPLIAPPRVLLEELDGDEVVVRVQATPVHAVDGPALAGDVLRAVGREAAGAERAGAHDGAAA